MSTDDKDSILTGRERIRAIAASIAAATPIVGGSVEVLPGDLRTHRTDGAFGRIPKPRHKPAGSKLWRKAEEGKL